MHQCISSNFITVKTYDPMPKNPDGSIRWFLWRWDDGKQGCRRLVRCAQCGALFLVQSYRLNKFSQYRDILFEDFYAVTDEAHADRLNRTYTGIQLEHALKAAFRLELPDLPDINARKAAVRKEYLSIRRSVTDKPARSLAIAERLFQLPEYISARTIALYKSLKSEADTDPIIARALASGKRVALPKVFGSEMRFFEIGEGEELHKSAFGVLEPAGDEAKHIPPGEFDLVIVPGVCFDRDKNRMGFGRGYYDRFLAKTGAKTAALCFSAQLAPRDIIPTDEYDIKMQKIITENETI